MESSIWYTLAPSADKIQGLTKTICILSKISYFSYLSCTLCVLFCAKRKSYKIKYSNMVQQSLLIEMVKQKDWKVCLGEQGTFKGKLWEILRIRKISGSLLYAVQQTVSVIGFLGNYSRYRQRFREERWYSLWRAEKRCSFPYFHH